MIVLSASVLAQADVQSVTLVIVETVAVVVADPDLHHVLVIVTFVTIAINPATLLVIAASHQGQEATEEVVNPRSMMVAASSVMRRVTKSLNAQTVEVQDVVASKIAIVALAPEMVAIEEDQDRILVVDVVVEGTDRHPEAIAAIEDHLSEEIVATKAGQEASADPGAMRDAERLTQEATPQTDPSEATLAHLETMAMPNLVVDRAIPNADPPEVTPSHVLILRRDPTNLSPVVILKSPARSTTKKLSQQANEKNGDLEKEGTDTTAHKTDPVAAEVN